MSPSASSSSAAVCDPLPLPLGDAAATAQAPATPPAATPAANPTADTLVARGAYLGRAGNCLACHTTPGGAPGAGGRGIDTPFGTVYASNITPDPQTGIGGWTNADFWQALHHGKSRDGRRLYPAFPYPSYTQVTRADADALYAWLMSLPPAQRAERPLYEGSSWAMMILASRSKWLISTCRILIRGFFSPDWTIRWISGGKSLVMSRS